MPHILLVEDEVNLNKLLTSYLKGCGYTVKSAFKADEALALSHSHIFDVVVTDIRMEGMDGVTLMQALHKEYPSLPVILITAYGSKEDQKKAIHLGAFDYLVKPFNFEELHFRIQKALDYLTLEQRIVNLEEKLKTPYRFAGIVGKSPAMRNIIEMIKRLAPLETTVLIVGESGTGKEIVAQTLHNLSPRKDMPFISINCGALPETLLESELFGYVKGAFTGAERNHPGLFKEADGGTLFMDEISEMTPMMQVKLLRVLQERKVRPIGGTRENPVDVRVISATNKDLSKLVEEGKFREDLYYRIKVVTLEIPPLRQRREDIPLLVQHFLERLAKKMGRSSLKIAGDALHLLEAYHWPGNVRELENVIERTIALVKGNTIHAKDLPDHVKRISHPEPFSLTLPDEGIDLTQVIQSITVSLLRQALEKCGGSQTKAAKLLRITPRSMRYYMKKYGLR